MEHLTNFDSLINEVKIYLDAEGYDGDKYNKRVINDMLRTSYIEFVKDSECIINNIEIVTQKDVNEYPLFNVNGYNLKKIKSLNFDGCCLKPMKTPCHCGCCTNKYSYHDGWLRLCKAPDCDGKTIEICGVFFPEITSCKPEKRIIELYGTYIIKGAMSRLLGITKTKYTYYEEYLGGKEIAEKNAAESYSRINLSKGKPSWIRF